MYYVENRKYPSPFVSLLPIVVLIILLFFTIRLFGADALGGGSQICLLVTTALCAGIGMVGYHIPWKDIEHAIVNNIAGVSTALIILLIIGALSAAWMLSGVVPTLIYYGVQVIHPKFFLVSCCIICAVVSVMTGSSWTTIATIGIALLGIGKAQGFEEGWIAGAIISGAYFGDKISPLSDTTVLASSVTDTPLFTHIRYMIFTTVPSMLITLAIFTTVGFMNSSELGTDAVLFTDGLAERFHISLWLLIVPVITGILLEIAGTVQNRGEALYRATLTSLFSATQLTASSPELSELIATRGMGGMMDTIWLILCAMCLGGAMTACGMLGSITSVFVRLTRRLVGMIASTVGAGLFLNLATADQYISIILTGNMFKEIYRKNGYESRLLSRTTEDAVTVTSVLIPWNTCEMTQATILSVPTLTYLPYCFFNLLSPLMSILVASLGYKIYRIGTDVSEKKNV